MNVKTKKTLIYLFLFALVIRMVYDFYLQQYYFGHFVYKYNDSNSYINPILNLINHGTYMGNLNIEDSKYFRVPVYPSILGVIYLIFGDNYFDYAVAVFQAILDSFSTMLVYLILYNITKSYKIALISGVIYATYPFVIVWNPISYTEIVYIFLIWCLIYISLLDIKYKYFYQGLIITLLVLTKQYLGLMILLPMSYYFFNKKYKFKIRLKYILYVWISFIFTMSPWVIRNYIVSGGKLIVLRGDTIGIPIYGKDFEAFEKFANLFNKNITPIWDDLSFKGVANLGDKHKQFQEKYKDKIEYTFKRAYECGPSFVFRKEKFKPNYKGCQKEVIDNFRYLTKQFWKETPFLEAIETRVESFKKIFTKTDIVKGKIEFSKAYLFKKALFYYRIILIYLGIFGILYLIIKNKERSLLLGMFISAFSLYVFFSLVIVHTEIRYLLSPDLLLTIFSSVPLYNLFFRGKLDEKD